MGQVLLEERVDLFYWDPSLLKETVTEHGQYAASTPHPAESPNIIEPSPLGTPGSAHSAAIS